MKILKFIVLFIFILSACKSPKTEKINEKDTITVSILPQKYFVEKIAGDHFNINVMIPPGASPVTYEPTPVQMKELSNSFVYFKIGYIEFEKSWMGKITSINPQMQVIDISKNVNLIKPKQEHDADNNHEEHQHYGVDPHIWTSPKEVKNQVELIYNFLAKEKSKYKNEFENNYNAFIQEIDSLDNYLTKALSPYKNQRFLIFHPALSYIARDYGLTQISIEIDGKEPTPANIMKIIDLAKKENIKIVFVQKQFSTHNAEVIARETNSKVVKIDPLDYNWLESIKFIANEIVNSYSK